ncbi:MAG: hypothetical protein NC918_06545, partial [Candidatus Omnitrophica bacterium]|nr:hypothetical protein [Candidatus Omnitrophota bacterium]
ILTVLAFLVGGFSLSAEEKRFDIYTEKNSPTNHFIPSGWMGDYGDLKFNDQASGAANGLTCIKITYTAKRSQGNGWAGIYWLSSQNNWGTKDTGYDLTGFNKLVFKAKGQNGGEIISSVKIGGIIRNASGEKLPFADSDEVEYGKPIRLTKDWQEYYINLVDKDLHYINGGFCITFNAEQANNKEQTIYLDDIYFTYDPNLKKEEAKTNFPFYVYADAGSLDNHFIPSGWMPNAGAGKDIKLDLNWKNMPFSGNSCIRVEYRDISGNKWAGIYWQQPANNWGNVPKAGYNLTGATKLTFWARGEKGGEVINEFKVGGISSGEYPDSDSASIVSVQLTKDWQKYEIDLRGKDLSYIIGGFCWATNLEMNDPEGIVFYLDEIKFEKD